MATFHEWRQYAYPIIVVTGYTDDVMLRNGVIADEVELMQKPFTPAILARKVHEVLARDREGAASAA